MRRSPEFAVSSAVWMGVCVRLLLAAVLVLAPSCAASSIPTGTQITPEFFKYATVVVAPTDGSTGGWRAVCIKASTGQRIANANGAHVETGGRCGLEFGTPIVNRQHGYIPLRMAQLVSAEVANTVAYAVLSQERGVTAMTCRKLIKGMSIQLDIQIKGSRVTECGVTQWSHSVPEVHWPPQ